MAIKGQYIIERDGKPFVLYAGLLDAAHELGLRAITTTLVQIPNEMNMGVAICHATVELIDGEGGSRTFTGIGDAGPGNLNRMMAPHSIRMAETRAKSRALRDAVNVAEALADDETSHEEHDEDGDPGPGADRGGRAAFRWPSQRELVEEEDGEVLAGAAVQHQRRLPSVAPAAGSLRGGGGPAAGGGGGGWNGQNASAGGAAATPKQLETIARMARAAGEVIDPAGFTRAQASETIQRLIAGMGGEPRDGRERRQD